MSLGNFLTNGDLWMNVLFGSLYFFAALLGVVIVGGILVFTLMAISKTNWYERICKYLTNGYKDRCDSRRISQKELEETKKLMHEERMSQLKARPAWECPRCKGRNESENDWCYNCSKHRPDHMSIFIYLICDPISGLRRKLGAKKDVQISKDTVASRLNFFNMIGAYLWGIKKGLCPIVLMLNKNEIKEIHEKYKLRVPTVAEILISKGLLRSKKDYDLAVEGAEQHTRNCNKKCERNDIAWWLAKYYNVSKEEYKQSRILHDYLRAEREIQTD